MGTTLRIALVPELIIGRVRVMSTLPGISVAATWAIACGSDEVGLHALFQNLGVVKICIVR